MRKWIQSWITLLLLVGSCFQLQAEVAQQPPVQVTLLSDVQSIEPGKPFWLLLTFSMEPDWHLYWKNPGEMGVAPQITWKLPKDFEAHDTLWQTPSRVVVNGITVFGYSKESHLLAQIDPPDTLQNGSSVTIGCDISWVACGTSCVPEKRSLELTLPVETPAMPNQETEADFRKARKLIPKEREIYSVKTTPKGMSIEILAENEPFTDIQSINFFPEKQGVLDINFQPKWSLQELGQKLVLQFPKIEEKNSCGVAVIVFTPDSLQKNLAIQLNPDEAIDEDVLHIKSSKKQALSFFTLVINWYQDQLITLRSFFTSELSYILFIAFLGGMILNLMPCVLPVISLKVLHFMQMQGQKRSTTFKHGLAFSFGILFAFWMLSAAIYGLQAFGKTVGWGFQLQEPLFVAFLVIILFILSLSLFGVFEFGTKVASIAGQLDEIAKLGSNFESALPSAISSFFSGVLATFVATPCTGPLLGSAIGFTATLHPAYAFVVFSCLGFGMAFPYLFLSIFPELVKILPKPGRWLVTFKQLMGFFLLATVLWLVWVLFSETNNLSQVVLFISLFLISFGTWIYGTWAGFERKKTVRSIAKVIAAVVVIFGAYILLDEVKQDSLNTSPQNISKAASTTNTLPGEEWEEFSFARLYELRQKGIPLFLDFSAKWCLTCQANYFVLESAAVREAFIQYGVVKMHADWTQGDERITQMLRSLGRNGVPVYALYGKDPTVPPTILPEIITPELIVEYLKNVH